VVNRKLRAANVAKRVGLETDVKTEKARTMSRKA